MSDARHLDAECTRVIVGQMSQISQRENNRTESVVRNKAIQRTADAAGSQIAEAAPRPIPKVRAAVSVPVTLSFSHALFTPPTAGDAQRNLSVLFISPWGLEELSTRRFYRVMAEAFAEAGCASLRFDLPGTANARDFLPDQSGLAPWHAAIAEAVTRLRSLTENKPVVLVGQGVGGTLALTTPLDRQCIAGVAALAPVVNGRGYLRELSAWAKMADAALSIKRGDVSPPPGTIAGFEPPPGVADAVKAVKLPHEGLPEIANLLVAARPGDATLAPLADHFEQKGSNAQTITFEGYQDLLQGPMTQIIPEGFASQLRDWLVSLDQTLPAPRAAEVAGARYDADVLLDAAFSEQATRFGPGGRLYGIFCEPRSGHAKATVILLTTAHDPLSGWARFSTDLARRLASRGIASFRFDSAGVGDSLPIPGRKRQILYDHAQIEDMSAAIDLIEERGLHRNLTVFGRCSGAYTAYHGLLADDRLAACISVNLRLFRWRSEPTDAEIAQAPRSLDTYARKAVSMDTARRLIAGEIDLRKAGTNIARKIQERIERKLMRFTGPLLAVGRFNRIVHGDFRRLASSGKRIVLVYSEQDEGEESFAFHFGDDGSGLRPYHGASHHRIPATDHNVTDKVARAELFRIVDKAIDLGFP